MYWLDHGKHNSSEYREIVINSCCQQHNFVKCKLFTKNLFQTLDFILSHLYYLYIFWSANWCGFTRFCQNIRHYHTDDFKLNKIVWLVLCVQKEYDEVLKIKNKRINLNIRIIALNKRIDIFMNHIFRY